MAHVHAQGGGTSSPPATPSPVKKGPALSAVVAQSPAQPAGGVAASQRESRARAYAKLLEGQRYISRARGTGGITRESLATAQEALREAARLDPTLAEAHTALAEIAFFFLNDSAEAEREGLAAIKIDPNNLGAHRLLARLYSLRAGVDESRVKREDAELALREWKEVTRLFPADAEAWALLGEFYHLTGREAQAIEAFRRWTQTPPGLDTRFYQVITQGGELSPAAAQARLAQSLLRAGRGAEAVAALRQALSSEPENERYLQLLEEAAGQGSDASAALQEIKRMVAANPANASAAAVLARAQARAGKTDDAIATLRAALAKSGKGSKEREQLVETLAQTYADALRYEEAVSVFDEQLKERGITDAPLITDNDKQFAADYLQRIINLQRQAGRTDAALATVERARRLLGANDAMIDYYAVELLREQGKRREALEAVRAARLKYPENASFLRLEATTLAESGRVDEAAALLRSRLNGNFENDYNNQALLAQVYIDAGRGREAVEAARKLVEMTPAQAPTLLAQSLVLLSSAQERAGDFKGAEASLRRILENDPNNPNALNNLGYFLTERGERLPEALDMIRRAVRAAPTNASYLDSLGWVHFKLGQMDEAERYLSDAARRNPRSATIQEHLGDLLQKRGRTEEARAAWRRALSLSVEPQESDRLRAKIGGTPRR